MLQSTQKPDPYFKDCDKTEPFIKVDPLGQAPLINYNLPTDNYFASKSYIVLDISSACFKAFANAVPADNFWDRVNDLSPTQLAELVNDDVAGFSDKPLFVNSNLLQSLPIINKIPRPVPGADKFGAAGNLDAIRQMKGGDALDTIRQMKGGNGRVLTNPTMDIEAADDYYIAGLKGSEIIKQINKGRMPMLVRNFAGLAKIKFIARPVAPRPRIAVCLHYKTALFPLNYGMGKVVKTFSLFPGEVTTFNVRSFKHDEENRSRSENIFDSRSTNFANDFESQVQNENMTQSQTQNSTDFSTSTGIEIGGAVSAMLGVGGGASVDFGTSFSTVSQNQHNSINSVINNTTSESNFSRDITINTEVSTTSITELEETTTRQIRNENRSRTLNFVFRQLMQEYMAVTYLDDVSLHYSNGYPESYRTAKLENIYDLLTAVLQDAAAPPCDDIIEKVREEICFQLCNIFDYEGVKKSFVKCSEQELTDCCGEREPVTKKIILKTKDRYEIEGRIINGIVVGVNKYVVKTDGVIVDALLGGGEALDCYNSVLQKVAISGGILNLQESATNLEASQQRIEIAKKILDTGTTAEVMELIKNYNYMFGTCCATPQSTNGCCCADCAPATPETPATPE